MEKSIKDGEGFTVKEKDNNPQLDFSTFILSLATSALMQMGIVPDPQTKKSNKNLPLAKQNIDLLALLSEKTAGNLSESEKELLANILTEIRLKFVEVSKS